MEFFLRPTALLPALMDLCVHFAPSRLVVHPKQHTSDRLMGFFREPAGLLPPLMARMSTPLRRAVQLIRKNTHQTLLVAGF